MSFTAYEGRRAAQDTLDSLDENAPILLLVGLARAWRYANMEGPNRCYNMALGIVAQIHKVEEAGKTTKAR